MGAWRACACDAGKFTLAFTRLDQAIRWACQLQLELLRVQWPDPLLTMAECREVGALALARGQALWLHA